MSGEGRGVYPTGYEQTWQICWCNQLKGYAKFRRLLIERFALGDESTFIGVIFRLSKEPPSTMQPTPTIFCPFCSLASGLLSFVQCFLLCDNTSSTHGKFTLESAVVFGNTRSAAMPFICGLLPSQCSAVSVTMFTLNSCLLCQATCERCEEPLRSYQINA
jgi:hypothetical protein